MPKPRTPTSVLEAKGALAHDPKRYAARQNEPKPTAPLGEPPAHLDVAQRKTWRELARLAPAGVLADCDRWIVELAVLLMTKLRTGTFTPANVGHLRSCLASLGMTPADRSRVSAKPDDKPAEDDPLTYLM